MTVPPAESAAIARKDYRAALDEDELVDEDGTLDGDETPWWFEPEAEATEPAKLAEAEAPEYIPGFDDEPEPKPKPKKPRAKPKDAEKGAAKDVHPTLSEGELAEKWLQTPDAGQYLHADGVGWKRYQSGYWSDAGHDIYQSVSAHIRGRVEKTKAARSLNRHSTFRNAVAYAEEWRAVDAAEFDGNPMLVPFSDGTVLDVRTWTRRPAEREDMICQRLPVTPSDEPSQLWSTFLYSALGHYPEERRDEIAAYLQEWAGVSLTGDTRDEAFIFLWGSKGTGKGTFSETLAALLGPLGTVLSGERVAGEQFQHRQWVAGLQGKRFILVNELPDKGRWKSEELNKLISGEMIEAQWMRQNSFWFRSQAHICVVGNTQPTASAASGIWRRVQQIEFRHKPATPDKLLKEKLLADLPGVLAWALEGLKRWADRGSLVDAPREIQEGVEAYANASDPIAAFISECTTPSAEHRIEVNRLYEAYAGHFRTENGADADVFPKQRTFARRVSDLWGTATKSNGRGYRVGHLLIGDEDGAEPVLMWTQKTGERTAT